MGTLQMLFEALERAPSMQNISLYLGKKNLSIQDALPRVVVVPTTGSYVDTDQPGYMNFVATRLTLQDKVPVAGVQEHVDFHLYAIAPGDEATEADHFSAIEELRASVIQALKRQKQTGIYYAPVSEEWDSDESNLRAGHTLKVTVRINITVPGEQSTLVKIRHVSIQGPA